MRKGIRTAAKIAKLLGVEGYSDFVHNQVKQYWRNVVMRRNSRKNVNRLDKDFSAFMADATPADRLLVGKFIALKAKENFDTGLRIGLMAHAHEHDKELPEIEQ